MIVGPGVLIGAAVALGVAGTIGVGEVFGSAIVLRVESNTAPASVKITIAPIANPSSNCFDRLDVFTLIPLAQCVE